MTNKTISQPLVFRTLMKTFPILIAGSLTLVSLCGCNRQSVNAPPAGTFRLAVGGASEDGASRTVSLRISSAQPGWVTVRMHDNQGDGGARGEMLISTNDKLRGAQVILEASRTNDAGGSGVSIETTVRVRSEGGDGDMLINGSFEGATSRTYPAPADSALEHFLKITATNGVYPLNQPLEIARPDGHPVTLTVGDAKK
jgi:hypothetical protein